MAQPGGAFGRGRGAWSPIFLNKPRVEVPVGIGTTTPTTTTITTTNSTSPGVAGGIRAAGRGLGQAANGTGAGRGLGQAANSTGAGRGLGQAANGTGAGRGLGQAANGTGAGRGLGQAANGTGAGRGLGQRTTVSGAGRGMWAGSGTIGGRADIGAIATTVGISNAVASESTRVEDRGTVTARMAAVFNEPSAKVPELLITYTPRKRQEEFIEIVAEVAENVDSLEIASPPAAAEGKVLEFAVAEDPPVRVPPRRTRPPKADPYSAPAPEVPYAAEAPAAAATTPTAAAGTTPTAAAATTPTAAATTTPTAAAATTPTAAAATTPTAAAATTPTDAAIPIVVAKTPSTPVKMSVAAAKKTEREKIPYPSKPEVPNDTSTSSENGIPFASSRIGVKSSIPSYSFRPISSPASRAGKVLQLVKKLAVEPRTEAKEPVVEHAAGRLRFPDQVGTEVSAMGDDFQEPGSRPVREAKATTMIREVTVLHVEGPNNFYIKPSAFGFAALHLLQTKLDRWYKDYATTYPAPEIDELVKNGQYAGFISAINAWRRIVVRSWTLDGHITIQLLDDGGAHVVRTGDIRLLRGSFCTLPVQAFHAKIQMIEAEAWTAEETAIFKQDTNNETFLAVIIADEKDPDLAPFRTVGIALLETGSPPMIYTFGGRLQFGYAFDDEQMATWPRVRPAKESTDTSESSSELSAAEH